MSHGSATRKHRRGSRCATAAAAAARQHRSPHGAAQVIVLAAAGLGWASKAQGQTISTWLGGTGNWGDAAKWSPTGVPNSTTFDVLIDGGNATNSIVTMTNSAVVGALTLDAGDQLALGSSSQLTLTRDSTINGVFNGAQNVLTLGGSGPITLGGTGEIRGGTGDYKTGFNIFAASNVTVTFGPNLLVHHSGMFKAATNSAGFINRGTILAEVTTSSFDVVPLAAAAPLDNEGLIQVNGAHCTFASTSSFYNGPSGRIVVDHGTLALTKPWTNAGSLSVISGALALGGTVTPSDLAASASSLDANSTFHILGTLDNTGHVLNLNGTIPDIELDGLSTFADTVHGPTLRGGTITTAAGHSFGVTGGRLGLPAARVTSTFDGVTLDHATITTRFPGSILMVANGLTMHSFAIDFGGSSAAPRPNYGLLYFGSAAGNVNLIGGEGSIDLGGGVSTVGGLEPPATGSGVFGPGIQVHAGSLHVFPAVFAVPGDGQIINRGTFTLDFPGGAMTVGSSFVNDGVVFIGAGVTLIVDSQQTNYSQSNRGVLRLDGTMTTGRIDRVAGVTIASGLLEGSGTATLNSGSGSLLLGATLAPGRVGTVGTFTINGTARLTDGAHYAADIDPANAVSDLLAVHGSLDLSSVNDFLDINELDPSNGSSFLVATYTGARSGVFDHVTPGYTVSYDMPGEVWVNTVPEPGVMMLSLPLVGGIALRRRKRPGA